MKIIVTHTSPDWDAIGSVWLLKKFLPGWQDAAIEFVPAGQRSDRVKKFDELPEDPIVAIGDDEIIHVDTGMGPLDHHQTSDQNVCGASRCWDFVREKIMHASGEDKEKWQDKEKAVDRIVKIIVAIDHFREVFWAEAAADYHEFSLLGVLDGLKLYKPDKDDYYVEFGIECLESLLHQFENRGWAEKEIAEKGVQFETKWGKGIGFETINDTVLKLAQKTGYDIVVRKDPRKGYVRIKAKPASGGRPDIDLTLVYEKIKKIDPEATWYLHVSKKMLLNGTPKNPKMIPTKLSLGEIINIIRTI
jgi:hypothetical protein